MQSLFQLKMLENCEKHSGTEGSAAYIVTGETNELVLWCTENGQKKRSWIKGRLLRTWWCTSLTSNILLCAHVNIFCFNMCVCTMWAVESGCIMWLSFFADFGTFHLGYFRVFLLLSHHHVHHRQNQKLKVYGHTFFFFCTSVNPLLVPFHVWEKRSTTQKAEAEKCDFFICIWLRWYQYYSSMVNILLQTSAIYIHM